VNYRLIEWLKSIETLRPEGDRILQVYIKGLLPIEWVIFWNLSVIPVFNGDAMADR
jgi:hypothetical protein